MLKQASKQANKTAKNIESRELFSLQKKKKSKSGL